MDRNSFLLTSLLILLVCVGALLNAKRVHDSEFLPVVVEESSIRSGGANGLQDGSVQPLGSPGPDTFSQMEQGKRSINEATVEELSSVSGIGEALASQIVKYRNMNGLYHTMLDLEKVHGIGKKRVELLSQDFEVKEFTSSPSLAPADSVSAAQQPIVQEMGSDSGEPLYGSWQDNQPYSYIAPMFGAMPQLVNINLADETQLDSLPEIGEVLARRIIEDRMRNGPYYQKQDITRVHGIGEKTFERIEPFITVGY